jgi:hypothetical protein
MDIHEALYTTRMMRRLRPDPIPLDTQARILDAAVRAPMRRESSCCSMASSKRPPTRCG